MDNTVHDSAIKKLKLIFTVVDRPKGDFYLDVISQFQVNCQLVMAARRIPFTFRKGECRFVKNLDCLRAIGKQAYGGGHILSANRQSLSSAQATKPNAQAMKPNAQAMKTR